MLFLKVCHVSLVHKYALAFNSTDGVCAAETWLRRDVVCGKHMGVSGPVVSHGRRNALILPFLHPLSLLPDSFLSALILFTLSLNLQFLCINSLAL